VNFFILLSTVIFVTCHVARSLSPGVRASSCRRPPRPASLSEISNKPTIAVSQICHTSFTSNLEASRSMPSFAKDFNQIKSPLLATTSGIQTPSASAAPHHSVSSPSTSSTSTSKQSWTSQLLDDKSLAFTSDTLYSLGSSCIAAFSKCPFSDGTVLLMASIKQIPCRFPLADLECPILYKRHTNHRTLLS
jgi:hypothetical protein